MKERKYKAFISYSHRDEKFATWLHKKLETYKIPKELQEDYSHTLPNKLFPLFRDRAELSTSPTLGEEILKALTNSEYLIVICSTYSAKSQYVNQEIIDFKRIHGEGKVHAIIIDGEPHAKESDKFSDDLECFPEALKYKVIDGKLSDRPIEPIAGDFRKGKDGTEEGKLKLIAGLLEVKFNDLNLREERRKRRNRWIWGVIGSILFVIMLGLTIFSLYQKDRAKQSEKETKNELYINSMQQGILYRDFFNEPIKAKHIFAKTISNSPDKEKENSAKIAYNALSKNSKLINIAKHSSAVVKAIFSNDEKKILSWDENGTVRLWDEETQQSKIIIKHKNEVYEAKFSNDGKKVLSKSKKGVVKFWSEKTNKVSVLVNSKNTWSWDAYGALFTKNGENIVFWGDKKVSLWDISTKKINSIKFKNDLVKVSFNKDEKEILLVCNNSISIWNRDTNKIKKIVTTTKHRVENAFYSNSKRYILYFLGTSVYIWDKRIQKSKKIITHNYSISGALFDKNETKVISWSNWNRDKTVRVWDEINGERIITKYKDSNNYSSKVILSKNSQFVVSWDKIRMFLWDSKNNIFRSTNDGKVNLFNKDFYEISRFHYYDSVTFDDTEENIIYKDDSSIYLWDITQNTQTMLINNLSTFDGYTIDKSKRYILAWDDFGNLILWNKLLEQSRIIIKHDSKVKGAIFSSDNRKILSWDENGNVKLLKKIKKNINIELYKYMDKYARKSDKDGIQLTKDGKELLVWSRDKGVNLLNTKTNTIKTIIPYREVIVDSEIGKISVSYATFNKNEDEVVSGGLDGKIKLWKRESDQIETIMEFNSKLFKNNGKDNKYVFIENILYSNDEKVVVAWLNKDNYKIKLWNRDTKKSRNIISCSDEGIYKAKFNHKGNQLLVLCRDGKLKLWDKSTNKVNIITDNETFFKPEFDNIKSYLIPTKSLFTLLILREESNKFLSF